MAFVADWQEEEERWDDFDQSSNGTTSLSSRRSSKAKVVGRSADPAHDPENWEDDFELDVAQPTSNSRQSQVLLLPSEQAELSKLLATLPPLDSVDGDPLAPSESDYGDEQCSMNEIYRLISQRNLDKNGLSESPPESLEALEGSLARAKSSNDSEGEVRALVEVAKAHRRSGQNGAAMLQLQCALQVLEDMKKTAQEQDLANLETQIHHEMSLTSRKIQDLSACKTYLNKALVSASSAVSLSPLWSPLWLRLHSDSAETFLLLGEKKPALQHISQLLAGLVARAPPDPQPPSGAQSDDEAWVTFLTKMGWACLYAGAILVDFRCMELAEKALLQSFRAFESVPDSKLSRHALPWLRCARQSLELQQTASEEEQEATDADQTNASDQFDDTEEANQEEEEDEDEEEGEEEDWDADLADEMRDTVAPVTPKLSLFGQSLKSHNPRAASLQMVLLRMDSVPDRCSIFRQLEQGSANPVKIVMYPTATHVYATQARLMTEHALHEWLDTMFQGQERARYVEGCTCDAEMQQAMEQKVCMALVGSAVWAQLMTELCFRLRKAGRKVECWAQLDAFFQGVKACSSKGEAEEGAMGWGELSRPWDEAAIGQACQALLHIAAKLWTMQTHRQFQHFLYVARTVLKGRLRGSVAIKELESLAHHSQDVNTMKSVAMPALVQLYFQAVHLEQEKGARSSESDASKASAEGDDDSEEKKREGDGGMQPEGTASAGGLYTEEPVAGEGDPCEIQAEALADLHLCASGLSPLTMTKLWTMVQATKSEDSVTTAAGGGGAGGMADAPAALMSNQEERMGRLERLYLRLRATGVVRAKCAFALAHHKLSLGSKKATPVAEQLLFESVHLLHRCPAAVPGVSLLVSCLGEAALTRYADALLATGKHMYAVLALEAAARCHLLRTGDEPHWLYRRLTLVCADHGEYRRSFEYYSKVRVEGQVNEFLFLSERVADLYMHLGDFASAETALFSASNLIKGSEMVSKADTSSSSIRSTFSRQSHPHSPPAHEHFDSRYLGLQIRLAKVMLAGCDRERGIHLLQGLSRAHLSPTSALQIRKLLASGLYQVDRAKEALTVIGQALAAMKGRVLLPADKFFLVSLEVRCHLRAGEIKHALQVVNGAIHGEQRVSALAHLFVLRGRTLFACARAGKPHGGATPSLTASGAADAFFSAWELYHTVGNRVPEAKAAARFVEAKLWSPGLLQQDSSGGGTPHMGPVRSSPFESPVMQRTRHRGSMGRAADSRPIWKRQLSDYGREQALDPDARSSVEKAAVMALETAVTTCGELRLLLRSQMNMAELLWFQGRAEPAVAHFRECRDLFFALFVRPDGLFTLFAGPKNYTRSCLTLVARMVRFVASMDSDFVKENAAVLDLFLHMEWLDEAHGSHECTADVWRVWSLLHQLRSSSRGLLSAQERRAGTCASIGQDEVLRQNISVLRQIHQITCRASAASPSPCGPVGDGIKRSDSTRWQASRKVYVLQVSLNLVVMFCRGSGRLQVRNLRNDDGEVLASKEELDSVCQLLLDDQESASNKERDAVRTFSRSALAGMLKAVLGDEAERTVPAAASTAGSDEDRDRRQSVSSESTDGGKKVTLASPSRVSRVRQSLLGSIGCFPSVAKVTMRKRLASSEDLGRDRNAPTLLACSSVLRALPWELVAPTLPMIRVLECRVIPSAPRQAVSTADKKTKPDPKNHFLSLFQKQPSRAEDAQSRAERSAMVDRWRSALFHAGDAEAWPQVDSSVLCPQLKQKKRYGLQRKYNHVTFLDATGLAAAPHHILSVLEEVNVDPVVILVPLHGIVRIHPSLMVALSHRPGCILAFCPQSSIKRLARTIENLHASSKTKASAVTPSEKDDVRLLLFRAVRVMHEHFNVQIITLTSAPYIRGQPLSPHRQNLSASKTSSDDAVVQSKPSLKRPKSSRPEGGDVVTTSGEQSPASSAETGGSFKKARKAMTFESLPDSTWLDRNSMPQAGHAGPQTLSDFEQQTLRPTEPAHGNVANRFSILAPSVSSPRSQVTEQSPTSRSSHTISQPSSLSTLSLSQTQLCVSADSPAAAAAAAAASSNPSHSVDTEDVSPVAQHSQEDAGGVAAAQSNWRETTKIEVVGDTAQSVHGRTRPAGARQRRRRYLDFQRSTVSPPYGPERSVPSLAACTSPYPPTESVFSPTASEVTAASLKGDDSERDSDDSLTTAHGAAGQSPTFEPADAAENREDVRHTADAAADSDHEKVEDEDEQGQESAVEDGKEEEGEGGASCDEAEGDDEEHASPSEEVPLQAPEVSAESLAGSADDGEDDSAFDEEEADNSQVPNVTSGAGEGSDQAANGPGFDSVGGGEELEESAARDDQDGSGEEGEQCNEKATIAEHEPKEAEATVGSEMLDHAVGSGEEQEHVDLADEVAQNSPVGEVSRGNIDEDNLEGEEGNKEADQDRTAAEDGQHAGHPSAEKATEPDDTVEVGNVSDACKGSEQPEALVGLEDVGVDVDQAGGQDGEIGIDDQSAQEEAAVSDNDGDEVREEEAESSPCRDAKTEELDVDDDDAETTEQACHRSHGHTDANEAACDLDRANSSREDDDLLGCRFSSPIPSGAQSLPSSVRRMEIASRSRSADDLYAASLDEGRGEDAADGGSGPSHARASTSEEVEAATNRGGEEAQHGAVPLEDEESQGAADENALGDGVEGQSTRAPSVLQRIGQTRDRLARLSGQTSTVTADSTQLHPVPPAQDCAPPSPPGDSQLSFSRRRPAASADGSDPAADESDPAETE